MDLQNKQRKCSNLHSASISIGVLAIIAGGIFLILEAAASNSIRCIDCGIEKINDKYQQTCWQLSTYKLIVANVMAVYSLLSALEILSSFGLIWGIYKKSLQLIKAWLIVSSIWVTLHTIAAFVVVGSISVAEGNVIGYSVLVTILLIGMAVLSITVVLSFYRTIRGPTPLYPPNNRVNIQNGHPAVATAPEYDVLPRFYQAHDDNIYDNADAIIRNMKQNQQCC